MSYDDKINVLNNISLEIKSGQTVAFMGPSGSGKSSIVNLLLRLFDYTGSISVNEVELDLIDRFWVRSHISSVLQEPFLYSKTVAENIRISRQDASHELIEESARIAGVHDVISGFENSYNTLLGEKGVNLSGGQKQRIAIARAVIRNTPVLIFDDSLSAVDTETESLILSELAQLSGKITIIIIAHRITSVMNADQIFVMNHGKICQSGNHDQLINQEGMYQRIWKLQSELEESLQKELDEDSEIQTDNLSEDSQDNLAS
jgi:ATP-binding cassette subfamily B protein